MCPIAPMAMFTPMVMPGQCEPQWALLQHGSADKFQMMAVSVLQVVPVMAMQLQELPLQESGAAAKYQSSWAGDEDEEAVEPCGATSRAARRRLRQRANKKFGKRWDHQQLQEQQAGQEEGSATDEDRYFHEVVVDRQQAAAGGTDEDGSATDEDRYFTEVAVDLPLAPKAPGAPEGDGSATDEDRRFREVVVDLPLAQKAIGASRAAAVPEIHTFTFQEDAWSMSKTFPKCSWSVDMRIVPVCAYPLVERPEQPRPAPQTPAVRAAFAKSVAQVERLPILEVKDAPVMNTFIHFEAAGDRHSSSRRSRSC
mmetsp:Transcript_57891/g.152432  ORF Transcript_57891/g.152432 Transcript_57891/m.152432 type:complete len:311 (-) Transcript_57891:232-1164(-)